MGVTPTTTHRSTSGFNRATRGGNHLGIILYLVRLLVAGGQHKRGAAGTAFIHCSINNVSVDYRANAFAHFSDPSIGSNPPIDLKCLKLDDTAH